MPKPKLSKLAPATSAEAAEALNLLREALPDLMREWIRQAREGNSAISASLIRLAEKMLASPEEEQGSRILAEIRRIRQQAEEPPKRPRGRPRKYPRPTDQ